MSDLSETEFQRQVTDLAELLGWSWAHFRPARTSHGWKVPVSGPLGAGWPDLTLVRGDRLIFAELKRSARQLPTVDQVFALGLLGAAAEAYVWRPGDIDEIARVLGAPITGQAVDTPAMVPISSPASHGATPKEQTR